MDETKRNRYYIDFIKSQLDNAKSIRSKANKIGITQNIFNELIKPDGIKFLNEFDNFKFIVHGKLFEFAFFEKNEIELQKDIRRWFKAIFGIDFILDYINLKLVNFHILGYA